MKIFQLFLDTELNFYDFMHIKRVGGKISRSGFLHPYPLFLTDHATCYLDGENKD